MVTWTRRVCYVIRTLPVLFFLFSSSLVGLERVSVQGSPSHEGTVRSGSKIRPRPLKETGGIDTFTSHITENTDMSDCEYEILCICTHCYRIVCPCFLSGYSFAAVCCWSCIDSVCSHVKNISLKFSIYILCWPGTFGVTCICAVS